MGTCRPSKGAATELTWGVVRVKGPVIAGSPHGLCPQATSRTVTQPSATRVRCRPAGGSRFHTISLDVHDNAPLEVALIMQASQESELPLMGLVPTEHSASPRSPGDDRRRHEGRKTKERPRPGAREARNPPWKGFSEWELEENVLGLAAHLQATRLSQGRGSVPPCPFRLAGHCGLRVLRGFNQKLGSVLHHLLPLLQHPLTDSFTHLPPIPPQLFVI